MSCCNHEIENEIIETQDENGNTVKFEIIDIIDFEDKEYALLHPLNENSDSDDENEDEEAVIVRLLQENEEYVFELIDDDEEFKRVEEYIKELQEIL